MSRKNIETRVAKLETAISGGGLHYIGCVIAREGETAVECITRVAAEQGLALSDVGHAVVFWRDNNRLRRHETYRHPDIHDITTLIGYVSQDERVKARERRRKEEAEGQA